MIDTNPVLAAWLPYHRSGVRMSRKIPVFCLPYAGGTARIYRPWVMQAPPNIEIVPIQLPGREKRMGEPAFTRMDALIDSIIYFFESEFSRGPFALFGHSMGGKIAFELARTLEKHTASAPAHLFVSGISAPQLRVRTPRVHQLADEALLDELRRLNGTPEELLRNEELMGLMLPFIRADYTLSETWKYRPGAPLRCPITAFGGRQDPDADETELAAWRQLTSNQFEMRLFEGDHFFIHNQGPLILGAINDCLQKTDVHFGNNYKKAN